MMRVALLAVTMAGGLLAQRLRIPGGLDAYMPVPQGNPLTAEKIRHGRDLFRDKRLSADGTVACASCHDAEYSFTTKAAVATGLGGQKGTRRPPRLINRAWGRTFFWDGRAASLEDQVLQPIANPAEMGSKPDEAARRAGTTVEVMRDALASYVRSILSGDSRYDAYLGGDSGALSAQEAAGLKLFTGKAGCSGCHVGPNLTDERFHNTGIGKDDEGRFAVSHQPRDRGAFRTPGLREVAGAPPFMHDGSLATVADVIEHYDQGGRANGNLDREIRKLGLTAAEKQALAAFLRTLMGKVRDGA
jgi:cytochrome c peroxidase